MFPGLCGLDRAPLPASLLGATWAGGKRVRARQDRTEVLGAPGLLAPIMKLTPPAVPARVWRPHSPPVRSPRAGEATTVNKEPKN